MNPLLFVFGAALGSFINVLAVRYDSKRFIFDAHSIGGRSHCPTCSNVLRWFELVPILSFLFQRGRCRRCKSRISVQYLIVELLAGLICVFVPWRISAMGGPASGGQFLISNYFYPALWVLVFLTLLLVVLIDKRLYIIPDEANIFLGFMGAVTTFFVALRGEIANTSFVGQYALIFGFPKNVWINHILAACAAGVIFALIIGITRGKGMGMGDLKLVIPLGLMFGWPDIILVIALSFVIGALYGACAIAAGKKNLKSALPFGPFLAFAAVIIFFWGQEVISWYMRALGV
ncbi:MAG: hypothetical protein A3B25_01000 [Candidatus Ryanbacteria bacterium RIFCSPLOWO2_01_FULL_48_26]|uniref:Prepilin peptidase n=1 Tax=Candidatus Ryanbacteria bacterium RIFCSPLOWO2_01_FULL_48_26 TaxID=1802126 RepID=A0A1G2GRB1_9BACT|nr:MAG: hypothetical protein A3B25_01000 [Candidatus Ryanbacteria bacterium RIFCSPLOWO2_01_FULL_48_26]OHB22698.1 MAG: hypothetical protein A3J67_06165 [Parcubacteria group bacterium RIFCSPHIGHO2_02_FULL_48_10b]